MNIESKDDQETLRRTLAELASQAGKLSLEFYENTSYELKPDESLITEADRSVEAFLREELRQRFPDAAFLGEETVASAADQQTARDSEWVFSVDPVDGTTVFVDGVGTYTVVLGLLRHGTPYAGAVAVPAQNRLYTGVVGLGAFYQDRPIHARNQPPEVNRRTIYTHSTAHRRFPIRFPGKTRSLGSTALHYLLVARGVAMGAISSAHIWDYAAPAAILHAAGGVMKHLDGTDVRWTDLYDGSNAWPPVLGAPSALWEDMADVLSPPKEG